MNRVDNINRCALEIIQMGYRIFSISKTKCFVYKLKNPEENENGLNYFKRKKFLEYELESSGSISVFFNDEKAIEASISAIKQEEEDYVTGTTD